MEPRLYDNFLEEFKLLKEQKNERLALELLQQKSA